jgi:hypothetical protein
MPSIRSRSTIAAFIRARWRASSARRRRPAISSA